MSSTDISAIVRSYVERALRDVPGMKALLLDADTNRTVSTVLSQSDILDQEVYLVERIDDETRREALRHLKAVALLRPSRENIARLRRELREPRFGGYHLCESRAGQSIKHLVSRVRTMKRTLLDCCCRLYKPRRGHAASGPGRRGCQ